MECRLLFHSVVLEATCFGKQERRQKGVAVDSPSAMNSWSSVFPWYKLHLEWRYAFRSRNAGKYLKSLVREKRCITSRFFARRMISVRKIALHSRVGSMSVWFLALISAKRRPNRVSSAKWSAKHKRSSAASFV